jgi:Alginate lyase
MRRLSVQMPALTAAWLVSKDRRYADHAVKHLRAWFIEPETRMNPNLLYSQAIKNKVTGRSIGVIDTIHLVEVARAASVLEQNGALPAADRDGVKKWFSEYLTWLTTHEFGTTERDAKNNHGTCWVLQAAEFARLVGQAAVTADCRDRYKKILLPGQLAADGSFPQELRRTKPYGYSLFNIDIFAGVCQILSTPEDNLWTYQLPDGRGMAKAMAYIYPFIADKKKWPLKPDVMYWNEWPIRHPCLLFGGLALQRDEYIGLWKKLKAEMTVDEVIRNVPIRQPVLWL